MSDTVRIGIIGTGIGATHAKVFSQIDGANVVAIASADRHRAEGFAAKFHVPLATDDYREVLTADLDAVVIATPPTLHREMVLAAIDAGKHVFCEKPLAASLDDSLELLQAAEKSGIVHLVNFHLRYESSFRTAAELVQSGQIGAVTNIDALVTVNPIDYLNASFGSTSKTQWFTDAKQGGGLLRSSAGPHLIDLVLWLGGAVESLTAAMMTSQSRVPLSETDRWVDVAVDDGFAVIGRLASAGLVTLRGVPVAEHHTDFSVTLHGTQGSLYVGTRSLRGMLRGETEVHSIPLDERNPRRDIASAFVSAMVAGGPSGLPDFAAGARSQAVLDACVASSISSAWVPIRSLGLMS